MGGGGRARCRDGHLSSAGVDKENYFAVGVVRASHVCVYARTGAGVRICVRAPPPHTHRHSRKIPLAMTIVVMLIGCVGTMQRYR